MSDRGGGEVVKLKINETYKIRMPLRDNSYFRYKGTVNYTLHTFTLINVPIL